MTKGKIFTISKIGLNQIRICLQSFSNKNSKKKRGKRKRKGKRGRRQHFGLGPEMATAHFPLLPEMLPPSLSLGH
jgi:hypothetical protein